MSAGPLCPQCGATGGRIAGHDVPGVYDGVLYWLCLDCGTMFHRFPEGHPLRKAAQTLVAGKILRGEPDEH